MSISTRLEYKEPISITITSVSDVKRELDNVSEISFTLVEDGRLRIKVEYADEMGPHTLFDIVNPQEYEKIKELSEGFVCE